MDEIQVAIPKLGESIQHATIVRWLKKVGESVALDEPLFEVSTDKVSSEIPSPAAGVVTAILAAVDQELPVGAIVAKIAKQGASAASTTFLSPAILRMAQEKGMSLDEVERVPGSGEGGRVTKRDVEAHAMKRVAPVCSARAVLSEEIETLKMSGMRKAIADNMVKSFYAAPHASLVTQVDVTDVQKLIAKEKDAFQAKWGVKLTLTAFLARALCRALKEFPLLNSSLEGDTILVKRHVNLGIAVSVEGGLLVPVIKSCQRLSLPEISKAISDLATRARASTLQPDEVAAGTITMSNFGMSGVLMGIPIIRHPEVAILGIGAVQRQVVPQDEDLLAIRSLVHLSLTFDHRVLDGMYGCGFMNALKQHIESNKALD